MKEIDSLTLSENKTHCGKDQVLLEENGRLRLRVQRLERYASNLEHQQADTEEQLKWAEIDLEITRKAVKDIMSHNTETATNIRKQKRQARDREKKEDTTVAGDAEILVGYVSTGMINAI